MKILNKFILVIIIIFILLPLVSMIFWSFFSSWRTESLFLENLSLRGFVYFFNSQDCIIALKSVLYSLLVAFISLVLSILLSRFFITSNFKYKIQLESLFYLPMLLPVVSVCIGSHKMFLMLFSGCSGLIVLLLHIYFSLPYSFKIVHSCYESWGIEQEQVARGLGASSWESFYLINVPVYIDGYVTSFIMAFIISYSQFFINFFIGDSRFVNFSMIMTPYITGSDRNISSVYTLMYILYGIIVMLFCSAIEKLFNKGRTV